MQQFKRVFKLMDSFVVQRNGRMDGSAYVSEKGIKKGYNRDEGTIMLFNNDKKRRDNKKEKDYWITSGYLIGSEGKDGKPLNIGQKQNKTLTALIQSEPRLTFVKSFSN